MEIMFGLRECLKQAVDDIRKLRFDRELIEVFVYNHALGFVSDEVYESWQERFHFTVS